MNFKKRVNGSWVDAPYYIHKTAVDTFTTLPVDVYADGNNATVGLKGNTVQNGTPTPDNPIMPQGTGERTGNLWSNRGFSATTITSNHTHNISNNSGTTLSTTEGDEVTITQSVYPTGNVNYRNGFFMIDVDFSKYDVGDVVTISFDYIVNEIHALSTQTATAVYAGKNSNTIPAALSSGDWKISGRLTAVITIIADMNPYVEVRLCGNSITVKNVMLNEGSTALPYEPYGYKIPISSANTATHVYLGEVESTRRIKKLVLDSTENWNEGTSNYYIFINVSGKGNGIPNSTALSTHTESGVVVNSNGTALFFKKSVFVHSSLADFKTYLAQQYAAGTPVTVWYVLATEETGIVNEPLMKIGEYADTLSNVSIPVTAGGDTLSVGTTVQPSEVTVNYKGWHPMQSVHERSNGAWT